MKLIQRLRNLWSLSELNVPISKKTEVEYVLSKKEPDKPQMATIIKRQTPAEKFLTNEQ